MRRLRGSGRVGGPDGDGRVGPAAGPRLYNERYSRWGGTLQDRPRIILDVAVANARHAFSSRWVQALIAIAWVFTVAFPLLQASFGGGGLVQDPAESPFSTDPEEYWSRLGQYEVDIPPTAVIGGNESAEFSLSVLNRADIPDVVTLKVVETPPNWSVEVRPEGGEPSNGTASFDLAAGEAGDFLLVVTPPPWLVSGQGAVAVEAESLGAASLQDGSPWSTAVTRKLHVIVIVGHREDSPYHVSVEPSEREVEVPAGGRRTIAHRIVNTGTMPDSYAVVLEGLPRGWRGVIDGLTVDHRGARVALGPGESRWFNVTYALPRYPIEHNLIAVVAASVNETTVRGSGLVYIRATDIPDKDMTGEVMAGPGGVMGSLYVLFAIFTAAVVGSRAISTDIRDRSTTIYLSRPITKTDYAFLKFISTFAVLSMVTLVPALAAFGGLVLLSDVGTAYFVDHLWAWGAVIAYGLLVTLVLASLSLGFSATTSRRLHAAFGFVVTALVTSIIAQILTGPFGDERGTAVSLPHSLLLVGMRLFDLADAGFDYDPLWNLASALAFAGAGAAMVAARMWRTELSE